MKKPNIVFVIADQMRASALGYLEIEEVKTPNLDRFADEGMLFTRAVSNHPLCCPARASIMTGLHSINHGLVTNHQQLDTDVPVLAQYLNTAGYKCGYIGKLHLDGIDSGIFTPPGPRRRGFDDLWAGNNHNHNYMSAYYYLNDNPEPVWIKGYEPDAQTDIAIDYIQKKAEDEFPFCLFLSWGPPHCPYRMLPDKYLEMYPPKKIKPKSNASENADKSIIAGYYSHVTALDDCFGRLINTIEKCGIKEDTIVVFTSDHGDMLFSHNKGWKMKPWAESVNIPFIIRWPEKIKEGRKSDAPLGLVDVMPTLLGLVGLSVPQGLDGNDLSELFLGDEAKAPIAQYIYNIIGYQDWSEGYNNWRGIVTREHTYIRLKDRAWLLFDDKNDPLQLNNILDDPKQAQTRGELETILKRIMYETGDPFYSSDESVEKYVIGNIVNSSDKEQLIQYLKNEYMCLLMQMNNSDKDIGKIAENALKYPDKTRLTISFENKKIRTQRIGMNKKLYHDDFFNSSKKI